MLHFKKEIINEIKEDRLDDTIVLANALTNKIRLQMLLALRTNTYSITNLANLLNIPTSVIIFHMRVLEKAKLIKVIPSPQKNKNTLYLSLLTNNIKFSLEELVVKTLETEIRIVDMPIGNYVKINENAVYGGFTLEKTINLKEPFDSIRFSLINLYSGRNSYIMYQFPSFKNETINELAFSLEICSESPNYNNDYCSDITFWINDIEILTYTSPADFGNRRGLLNPSWLSNNVSQYGQLVNIAINNIGTYLNGIKINNVTLDMLKLSKQKVINFSFGNKKGCINNGGFNLFGDKAGDYPQNIVMRASIVKE